MVQAIHTAVAGRARFKVEGLYRSKSLEKLLEYRLVRLTDISHASANALTGNVLVCFNSGNTPQTIASLIEKIVSQYQSHPQVPAAREPVARKIHPLPAIGAGPPPGSWRLTAEWRSLVRGPRAHRPEAVRSPA